MASVPQRQDDSDDVADALHEYKEVFLECRDLMHQWKVRGYYRKAGWTGTFRSVVCRNCGMERDDRWDGATVRHTYQQPEGYRIPELHVTKGDIRQEQLRRARVWESREEMSRHAPRVRKLKSV